MAGRCLLVPGAPVGSAERVPVGAWGAGLCPQRSVAGGVHVAARSTLGREFCKRRGTATDMTAGTTVDLKLGHVLSGDHGTMVDLKLGRVLRALGPVSRDLGFPRPFTLSLGTHTPVSLATDR